MKIIIVYKVYLTIHSALSRQQQPDDESILNKLLKKLDAKFKEIHYEKTQLLKTQWAETK
ncbi:hypothetical protein B1F79_02395 [Coxiella-like endosymbiont of Rhipicephalus sanguineus]|nr:hypothetical protein [Coxiella-like endosymbiont of Rhipicephalus sanguineus]